MRFGTDGIRGQAGRAPITPEVGVAVGRAAAQLARSGGGDRVIVGRDTRPSGPMLEAAVAAGCAAQGGQCLLAGTVPTSAVAMALHAGLADAAVVVTASHNPAADNGFKVLGAAGQKLSDPATTAVEGWLAAPPPAEGSGSIAPAQAEVWAIWQEAVLTALSDPAALQGRRIALDLAHGALAPAAGWIVACIPADWVLIGAGEGTINDGVGSEHLEALQRAVQEQGCDAGIAVDGDADRCRIVDEAGAPVAGDAVAWLLARALGARSLAVTVMSNGALEGLLPGVEVVRTAVGDRHVAEAMRHHTIPLGSEESGHVLFADMPTGDGLITGLRTLAAAAPPVSRAFRGFEPMPRVLRAVPVRRRPPLDEVPLLARARAAGLARLGETGRVFLRYSGTEQVLRILVEGVDPNEVGEVADALVHAAREGLA